jgi:hypothetical protein
LRFLDRLVLYDIWTLPADIDGDGKISEHMYIAGRDTGVEVFNAEWLFQEPLRIQGDFVNSSGDTITSHAGENIRQAYGLDLALCRDSDLDGWPDKIDPCPNTAGFKDGCN